MIQKIGDVADIGLGNHILKIEASGRCPEYNGDKWVRIWIRENKNQGAEVVLSETMQADTALAIADQLCNAADAVCGDEVERRAQMVGIPVSKIYRVINEWLDAMAAKGKVGGDKITRAEVGVLNSAIYDTIKEEYTYEGSPVEIYRR